SLRRAPVVDVADLVNATDGAIRRAGFSGDELALHIRGRVLLNRHARESALLATVVNQPVLADVEIARTGTATPLVRATLRNRLLKCVEAGVVLFLPVAHLEVNASFFVLERLQLAAAIVNDADGGREA